MLIRLDRINKIYSQDKAAVWALKNIDLSIEKGDFLSIVGPSGSGKTTLLNIIGLLDKPTSGRYFFNDKDITKQKDRQAAQLRNKNFGFIFQTFNLLPKTTAFNNVLLPLIYSHEKIEKPEERVNRVLTLVGLQDKMDSLPNQLSGGEQQRVAIARAIVNDPQIILADEPTGNLDTQSGDQIMHLLLQLGQEGRTIVLVTHNYALASRARRIVKLIDGKTINENLG